jgi:4-carboxymuconolactone decarboxylase
MSEQSRFDVGLAKRRQVIGDEYVERALAGVTDFDRDWQRILTEYCWGEVWGGSALSDRQRSLHNLCLLAALNRQHEFELHFRGALRNGCTLDELRETLIQIAVYVGVPAGVEAFRIARRVLAETGVSPAGP